MDKKTSNFFFGVHFMIDGYNAPADRLGDRALMTSTLNDIPKKMDMHTICNPVIVEVGPNNKKDPGGFSGFVMIAESHISFHTFPARGFITIDIYTCKDKLDTNKLLDEFRKIFQFTSEETHYVERGRNYPQSNDQ